MRTRRDQQPNSRPAHDPLAPISDLRSPTLNPQHHAPSDAVDTANSPAPTSDLRVGVNSRRQHPRIGSNLAPLVTPGRPTATSMLQNVAGCDIESGCRSRPLQSATFWDISRHRICDVAPTTLESATFCDIVGHQFSHVAAALSKVRHYGTFRDTESSGEQTTPLERSLAI